ncbi:MAG: hypothetical protein P4L90_19960 [Rhodopila sp.]|nr:hypothetical protein [Rhodopila sp.]
MRDSPIQIGTINLQDFEIPPSVRFGGRHRLAVHKLSNGRRVVERLGPDDGEISFQGTFSGPNAEARARAINNLRLSGETVWLTWVSFRHRVVVKSFLAEYRSPWWIPYRVSCIVVNQAGITAPQSSAIAALVSADLSNAMSAASGSSVDLTSLQTSLRSNNAFTAGTSDQMQSVAVVGATLAEINGQISEQSVALIAPMDSDASASNYSQSFAAKVVCAGSLAAAVSAAAYVGRIGINLSSTGD